MLIKFNISIIVIRSIIFGFLLLQVCYPLYGQKIVADFSFTDSEGRMHQLYKDYLDKKKVVVIDLFFVDCPPCNLVAPYLKESYERWGNGEGLVEFFALSPFDNDTKLELYKSAHFLDYPFSGTSGGGSKILEQFTNGFFGQFDGYPTLIIIRPDGTVIYDISSYQGDKETVELLDFHIQNVIAELRFENDLFIYPNPSFFIPNMYFDALPGSYDLIFLNTNGQIIQRSSLEIDSSKRVDLKNYLATEVPSGTYNVVIINKEGNVVQSKIVIL